MIQPNAQDEVHVFCSPKKITSGLLDIVEKSKFCFCIVFKAALLNAV
jgi:hypothetical protein